MMRTSFLLFLLSITFSLKTIAQSENNTSSIDEHAARYHRYLDMALDNWCVFFDNTGLDPLVYNKKTASELSSTEYSQSIHKKLLLAALKCEYNDKRLSYIDALIDYELVADIEHQNLLKYAVFYTADKPEYKNLHKSYLSNLDKFITRNEIADLKQELHNKHAEILSFQQIFKP